MSGDFKDRLIDFSVNIVKLTGELRKQSHYFAIIDQINRSATSVGANITEASGASSKKEFIRYYSIALRSANETSYWLKVLGKLNTGLEFQDLFKESVEISKIIAKSILTMKRNLE